MNDRNELLRACRLCPRECGIDRFSKTGFCGEGRTVRIARAELHMWEEPCISGENGSGTVFFSGCNLKCCFCQNYEISHLGKGFLLSDEELAETFLRMQEMGAHNINLVTPTHFVPQILNALEMTDGKLNIPVVYNCGGYENVEALKRLEGLIDIYLPDLKYHSSELSEKYSGAGDYFEKASLAIMEMVKQQPKVIINNGIMEKGVIIRHLVLPKGYKDSIRLMEWVKDTFPENTPLVSVMRQYTPCYGAVNFPEINRKLTTFEYDKVVERCAELGLEGFTQQKGCDTLDMTPDF